MLLAGTDSTLEHLQKEWRLSPLAPATGDSKGDLLLHVSSPQGPAGLRRNSDPETARRANALLTWYRGIGAVKLLRQRDNIQLVEWIDGPPLTDLLYGDKHELALGIYADVAKRLHRTRRSQPAAPLLPLATYFRPLLEQRFNPNPLLRHGARLIHHLVDAPFPSLPLHGRLDFDHILHHRERGWLAVTPLGMLGNPHFEPAPALCQPLPTGATPASALIRQRAGKIASRLSLDMDRMLTFAFCHACNRLIGARHNDSREDYWYDTSIALLNCLAS